jgi:integron integrase
MQQEALSRKMCVRLLNEKMARYRQDRENWILRHIANHWENSLGDPQPTSSEVQRELQGKALRMSSAIYRHGICSVDLERGTAGYRGLPQCSARGIAPSRLHRTIGQVHSCGCQRVQRLAYLGGSRQGADAKSPQALRERRTGFRSGPQHLRTGFFDHRSVADSVPLGYVSRHQSRDQTSHPDRPPRPHSHLHPHHRSPKTRCKMAGFADLRTGSHLPGGQGISRFCPIGPHRPGGCLLCHPGQTKHSIQPPVLQACGYRVRFAKRSDRATGNSRQQGGVSVAPPPCSIPGSGGRKDAEDAVAFLTWLATHKQVVSTKQNQAFNSLLFLFRHRLKRPYDLGNKVQRARRTRYVPVVLSREEVDQVFSRMEDPHLLIAQLLYGCGLRLAETLRLRVGQLNLSHRMLTIHRGKGRKDRAVPLPECLIDKLEAHLKSVRAQFDEDLEAGFGGSFAPEGSPGKWESRCTQWPWQFVFPAKTLTLVPATGKKKRYHVHDSHFSKSLRHAVWKAGISKKVGAHTFRHSFASHLLLANVDLRTIQEMMGHSDVKTTMIYTQTVPSRTWKERKSPLDLAPVLIDTV